MDPSDLTAFRDRELAVLTDRAAMSVQARREGRRPTSWSSEAVLSPERLAEFGSEPQVPFPGTPTLAQLALLSPLEFFIACLNAHAAGVERMTAHALARDWTRLDLTAACLEEAADVSLRGSLRCGRPA